MTSVHRIHVYLSIILVVVITGNEVSAAAPNPELRLVQVLFRHGDRTPDFGGDELYPKDPYRYYDFFPMGLGQLTNNGKSREYALGNELRNRYKDFLGKIYKPEAVVGHSSDYDRTKMSLQLVLAALYPPDPIQRWNKQLNWQPIPTTYVPRIEDNLFLSDDCPLFVEEYHRVLGTPVVARTVESYRDLMNWLSDKTGKNITTILDLSNLYHTLVAESAMNLTLPDWVHDVFPHGELWDAAVVGYHIANYNTKLRRLYAGHFLRQMTEHMRNYVNETLPQGRKIYLYSGHETNIASMLKVLNVFESHTPEYSSAVTLEFLQLREHFYVKINYYFGIPAVTRELRMPNCDVLCPFEKFLELTADVIPSDEELLCDKRKSAAFADTNSVSDNREATTGGYSAIQT